MENIKQYLKDEITEEMKEIEKKIKESNKDLEVWEAKIKVEKKMERLKNLKEELEDDVKYGVIALKEILLMEKNRNEKLKKEFELLRIRKIVVDKFEDQDL